eukprot:76297-Chlamydomonas_euryale.AAC.9
MASSTRPNALVCAAPSRSWNATNSKACLHAHKSIRDDLATSCTCAQHLCPTFVYVPLWYAWARVSTDPSCMEKGLGFGETADSHNGLTKQLSRGWKWCWLQQEGSNNLAFKPTFAWSSNKRKISLSKMVRLLPSRGANASSAGKRWWPASVSICEQESGLTAHLGVLTNQAKQYLIK